MIMLKKLNFILSFMLAAYATFSQEGAATSAPSNDSLNKSLQALKNEFELTKNLKIGGWVQAQYQYADTNGAKNFDGGDFPSNSNNRFMIRRGRIKFTYSQKNSQYVFQLNATERGVNIADCFAKYTDPWTHAISITMGAQNRPFGFEIQQSSADRESPERSRWLQNYLPNERDIGGMLTFAPQKKLKGLKLDAGFFNGTGIAVPGTTTPAGSNPGTTGVNGFTDFDYIKDFMGHLAYYNHNKSDKIKYGIGVSHYNGGFVYQNNKIYDKITTDSLGYKRWNVISDTAIINYRNKKAPRVYYGAEFFFSINTIAGTTTLRGEYFTGTQTSLATDPKSPQSQPNAAAAMYIRNFSGGYAYFIHRIGKSKHEVVVKYEWVDPNTKISAGDLNGKNGMIQGEIAYTILGFGYNLYVDKHVKFMFYYNTVKNEAAQISGFSRDLKDNIFTARLQYKF
jgi:hypothetical protein